MNLRYPKSINIGDLVLNTNVPSPTPTILLEKEWNPHGQVYTVKLLLPNGTTRECTWPPTWKFEVINEPR